MRLFKFFNGFLIGIALLGCKPTPIFIQNRGSTDIDSIKIARPLAHIDLVNTAVLEDSSTQISIRMEEGMMDALEYALPPRVHYKYLLLSDSSAAIVDSCLITIKNRLLVSANPEQTIPLPLIEMMRQDSIPFILWMYADGFEVTRKTYKWSKTSAIISNILGSFLGGGLQEMPTRGEGRMIVIIVDRDKQNIAFYKIQRLKNQYLSQPDNVEKAVTQLLNDYFYSRKK